MKRSSRYHRVSRRKLGFICSFHSKSGKLKEKDWLLFKVSALE